MMLRLIPKVIAFALLPLSLPLTGMAAPDADQISTQTEVITLPSGDSADLYAPRVPFWLTERLEDTLPLVILLQGALVDKARYSAFGQRLAACGYVVVIPNHQQEVPGFGAAWFTSVDVIDDVLSGMQWEDQDPDSVVFRILDTERLALVGHSYGGAVAINAAAGICQQPFACEQSFVRPAALKSVVVYGGSSPELAGDTSGVAVALLQGTQDGVAAPDKADQTLPLLKRPHALISITGANHYGICNEDDPDADPSRPTLDQQQGLDQIATWTCQWLRANWP